MGTAEGVVVLFPITRKQSISTRRRPQDIVVAGVLSDRQLRCVLAIVKMRRCGTPLLSRDSWP